MTHSNSVLLAGQRCFADFLSIFRKQWGEFLGFLLLLIVADKVVWSFFYSSSGSGEIYPAVLMELIVLFLYAFMCLYFIDLILRKRIKLVLNVKSFLMFSCWAFWSIFIVSYVSYLTEYFYEYSVHKSLIPWPILQVGGYVLPIIKAVLCVLISLPILFVPHSAMCGDKNPLRESWRLLRQSFSVVFFVMVVLASISFYIVSLKGFARPLYEIYPEYQEAFHLILPVLCSTLDFVFAALLSVGLTVLYLNITSTEKEHRAA